MKHALCAAAAAMAFAAMPAQAAPPAAAEPVSACPQGAFDTDPLRDRKAAVESMGQLPQACLREVFRLCSGAARSRLLDLGSAAVCSVGYEALLHRGFGGNFQALVAWWRSDRESAASTGARVE